MDSKKPAFASVDEYIASFPDDVQARLGELRATIKAAAPDATEKISYGMPTFALNGNLVYFAAHKNHIGFYPAPRGIEAFKEELAAYEGSKGTVQFPFDRPLPHDLIRRIVQFRAEENRQKAAAKARKKQ
jgi:uncharacterized protein YdhG (YjbR/CyaY superfamily)